MANKNPSVNKLRLIKQFVGVNRGYIRLVIELRDETELHVFEYIDSGMRKIDYSYHWQDKNKWLIKRWDNAPHHSEIETYPHHLHDGEEIKPSTEPNFVEILKMIG